jgi:hypothetical protein
VPSTCAWSSGSGSAWEICPPWSVSRAQRTSIPGGGAADGVPDLVRGERLRRLGLGPLALGLAVAGVGAAEQTHDNLPENDKE